MERFILTPYFLDQPLPGLETLVDPGWMVNNPQLLEGSPQSRMSILYEQLAEMVAAIIKQGDRPVSIAGDCCTSMGVIAGLQRTGLNPTLVWFDAHGDFNTWETTPSGFLGGMPLAMLVGRGEQAIIKHLGIRQMPESFVLLSDGRDLDPGEAEALRNSDVKLFSDVMDIARIDIPGGPIWVHFDTDLIDAGEAPAMNYPVVGGPGLDKLHLVFSCLAETGRICAVSMSTWNPELDQAERSQSISMALLAELLV